MSGTTFPVKSNQVHTLYKLFVGGFAKSPLPTSHLPCLPLLRIWLFLHYHAFITQFIREFLARHPNNVYNNIKPDVNFPPPELWHHYVECDGAVHRIARMTPVRRSHMLGLMNRGYMS